jgi:hypothetical protein
MKFFSKALLATTMKQAKIGCNVIISGKEIISVDACLEKGEYERAVIWKIVY